MLLQIILQMVASLYCMRLTIKLVFLVNDQRDAQFFSMYLFLFLTIYMFRAHRARHQERQTVSVKPLVAVGGRVVCR